MNIGEFIKNRRREKNITLRELGDITELSQSYLSQIENGTRNASPDILEKLSKALDLQYLELMMMAGFLHTEENDKLKEFMEITESTKKMFASIEAVTSWKKNFESLQNTIDSIKAFNNWSKTVKNLSIDHSFNQNEHMQSNNLMNTRTEIDIAYQINAFKEQIVNSNNLYFEGQLMTDSAKLSLIEFLELAYKQTQRINNEASNKQ